MIALFTLGAGCKQVAGTNFLPQLLNWVDRDNLPDYLGGTSSATLLDDAGPWQDANLIAEVCPLLRACFGPCNSSAPVCHKHLLSCADQLWQACCPTDIQPACSEARTAICGSPHLAAIILLVHGKQRIACFANQCGPCPALSHEMP